MISKRVIGRILAFVTIVGAGGTASAHTFEYTYNDDCCCEDVEDCTTGSSGNAACNAGHRGVESTFGGCGGIIDTIACAFHSCISLGNECRPDIGPSSYLSNPPTPTEISLNAIDDDCDGSIDECAPGSTMTCSGALRSCVGPFAGTMACGMDGFPTQICVPTDLPNADVCPKTACKGGAINNADADGDGLFDCWETEGIDYNGDNVVDFVIPGANPNHKDLYVEADYFDCAVAGGDCNPGALHSHTPDPAAITLINAVYANAPVMNPDGTTGITMHLLVDEAVRHRQGCLFNGTCYGAIKLTNYGTAAERTADPNVRLAKRLVYRYSLWAHEQDVGGPWGGRAGMPSGDLIVSLGNQQNGTGTAVQQAATFVHELGHQLGLDHGGGDSANKKPNYLSVMNYSFSSGFQPGNAIDYSRAALPTLNELALNEPAGIGDGTIMTSYYCPGYRFTSSVGNMPINWDCLPAPNGPTDLNVVGDINGDRLCVQAGTDKVLNSIPGGDDLVRGGLIWQGVDTTLQSTAVGDDSYVIRQGTGLGTGLIIIPGPNGQIDSPVLGDDQLLGLVIWDGADRTCGTMLSGDDIYDESGGASRPFGHVQPATLVGWEDWSRLNYEFTPTLIGFGFPSATVPPEMTYEQRVEMEAKAKIANLKLTQSFTRTPDGNVTIQLTLLNQGPMAAVEATVNDRLPAEVAYRSCTSTGGGVCSLKGNTVIVSFATLASGASASITIKGCSAAPGAITNVATVSSTSSDPQLSDNTATTVLAAPFAVPAVRLANGDMRYAITFSQTQAYVEAFVRVNGVQVTSGNIVGSKVNNPDGTFTYSRVVAASQYLTGDVLNVRFYSYRAGQPGVYTPGPVEFLSYPDFIYGTGSTTCSADCRPTFKQLANGDVKVTRTFTTPQAFVEAYVRRNGVQVAAGNIVQSGITNFDGTFTYSRVVPASTFQAGDQVTFRFFSNVTGGPPVYAPGPTQNTWFPGFTYNQAPTSDCP